jgi:phytoene dehydrogenase-like protein
MAVIGGGITGLSAAIAYALNTDVEKHPVVVIEKQKRVGGMVTSFKRSGFLFDTTQMVPDVKHILGYLGVEIPLKRFDGFYARIFLADPSSRRAEVIEIPSKLASFKQMLMTRYPNESRSIARLIDYSESMYDQLEHLKMKPGLLELPAMLYRCGKIIRHRDRTFMDYLDHFGIGEGEIREVFDVFAAFSGLPCERVATLMVIGAMVASMRGSYRPKQGFLKLPHKMRRRLEALGGEVLTRREVVKILVRDGAARGVLLRSGETIYADHVVTTVDTKVAMHKLVGDHLVRAEDPVYADRVHAAKMSPSAMSIHLGLDGAIDLDALGLDCGYNVITTGKGTFEKLFQAFDRGELGISKTCFHAAVICPSLTTGGRPSLVIRVVPMPIADWTALRENAPDAYARKKNELAQFFIDKVETYVIPELSRHIEVVDVASPATFARYSGSPTGSNYDMSPYPDNFGRRRLGMKTPIRGLYLPKFSHGIIAALHGGLHAADAVLSGSILRGAYTLASLTSRPAPE